MRGRDAVKKREYADIDAAAVFSLAVLVNLTLQAVCVAAAMLVGIDTEAVAFSLTVGAVVQLGFLALWFLHAGYRKIDAVGAAGLRKRPNAKQGLSALGLTVAVCALGTAITVPLLRFFDAIGYAPAEIALNGPVDLWYLIPLLCVLPAVCEEFLFRGVILRGLHGTLGKHKAAVLSAALFALFHLSLTQTFYQFVLGLILGYAVLMCGSVWVGVAGHFLSNLLALLGGLWGGDAFDIAIYACGGAALAALATGWTVSYWKARKRNGAESAKVANAESPVEKNAEPSPPAALTAPEARDKKRFLTYLLPGVGVAVLFWVLNLLQGMGVVG